MIKLLCRHDCEQDQQRRAQNQQRRSWWRWGRWYRFSSGFGGVGRSTFGFLDALEKAASNRSAASWLISGTDCAIEWRHFLSSMKKMRASPIVHWLREYRRCDRGCPNVVGPPCRFCRDHNPRCDKRNVSLNEFREQRKRNMTIINSQWIGSIAGLK